MTDLSSGHRARAVAFKINLLRHLAVIRSKVWLVLVKEPTEPQLQITFSKILNDKKAALALGSITKLEISVSLMLQSRIFLTIVNSKNLKNKSSSITTRFR